MENHESNRRIFLSLVLFLYVSANILGHGSGIKHFRHYPSSEYPHQHSLNWAFLQDSRGILYIGNQAGLLEYDGARWDVVNVPNNTARSLDIDNKNTIFVGGNNEIGFLTPDSRGALEYHSLVQHLEPKYKNFSWVFHTLCTAEGVWFRSKKYLFHWNYRQMKVWSRGSFDGLFKCSGTLFVHQKKDGLRQMKNGSMERLPESDMLIGKKIAMIVPFGKESTKLLIGTRFNGFYTYNGEKFETFATDVDDYLKQNLLIHGIALEDSPGELVLATRKGGLVIIDQHGKLKSIYNSSIGLPSDNIKSVYRDLQGNLWLATENGIVKIEYSSPITVYDSRFGLKGLALSASVHKKILYTGTSQGLFRLSDDGKFRQVPGISGMCYRLLSIKDSLLVAANTGLFVIDSAGIRQKVIAVPCYMAVQSAARPGIVWLGTESGLLALTTGTTGRHWSIAHPFKDTRVPVKTIVEDAKGNLWLGTQTNGMLKVDFSHTGNLRDHKVTRYSKRSELPSMAIRVFSAAGHEIFATDKGIYRFNTQKGCLVPDYTFGKQFTNGLQPVFIIHETTDRQVWIYSRNHYFQASPRPDGTYDIVTWGFPGFSSRQVNSIYSDDSDGTVWAAGNAGLFLFDAHRTPHPGFKILLRQVYADNQLLMTNIESQDQPLEVTFNRRNVQLQFAAPFFIDEKATRYRYLLEGLDRQWSQWEAAGSRDYIALEPGTYRFRAKAKNIFEKESNEIDFKFIVLPPWYRSWWAYTLYGVIFFFLLYGGVRWRLFKLEQEKRKLQKRIDIATEDIREKNQQLQKQAEELKEMASIRTRFFTNISHEFRTPLTLIMGPLEQMISQTVDEQQRKSLGMMRRNSLRLLTLINQLLALSRIDKGQMKLNAREQNIVPFLKNILASFHMAARHRKVTLTFSSQPGEILLYYDPEKLEDVFGNLLLNLVNLTPAKGTIRVEVRRQSRAGDSNGRCEITVHAFGLEISDGQREHMFDRFYMAEETYEHQSKGYSIGLALAKELIALHHGEIAAQRIENEKENEKKGTLFVVRLPMGHRHLAPGEIVDMKPVPGNSGIPGDIPVPMPTELPGKDEEETGTEAGEKESGKIIILVVEDNADTRSFIREVIEPSYTIIEAKDGREGIKKAIEQVPDLIISDIIMPYANGYQLCQQLKMDVRTSHIPIVLLTAKSGEEDILKGLETGADDYITKPFNLKLLQARIKNLIDLRRQKQLIVERQMVLQPGEVTVSPIDENFIKELQQEIEKNLSDPEFGVEQLAKKLYMSRATLYRKINALTGAAPHRFIRSYRLKRAAQLFKANFGNVSEIALEVGFNNISYFSQCFKEKFHMLPTEYRNVES